VRPNVRTYTALVTALGNGGQWARALDTLGAMRREGPGGHVEPNAYTYSALLKAMGEQGECALAEQVFGQLEAEALAAAALGGEQGAGPQTAEPAAWEAAEGRGDDSGAAAPAPVPGYPAGPLPGFETGPRLDLGFNHFLSAWGPIVTPASGLAGGSPAGQARCIERGAAGGGPEESAAEPGVERAGSYGAMPMLLAEQVLASGSPSSASTSDACALPDDLPGQVNGADAAAAAAAAARGLSAAAEPFSFFSAPVGGGAEAGAAAPARRAPARAACRPGEAAAWAGRTPPRAAKGLVNEVVCGAMMLAYERTGRWAQALGMLERAERLGLAPNTVMLNTALSALAKAGRAADAAALFARIPSPDAASYETLLAAHGLAADPPAAEAVFAALLAAVPAARLCVHRPHCRVQPGGRRARRARRARPHAHGRRVAQRARVQRADRGRRARGPVGARPGAGPRAGRGARGAQRGDAAAAGRDRARRRRARRRRAPGRHRADRRGGRRGLAGHALGAVLSRRGRAGAAACGCLMWVRAPHGLLHAEESVEIWGKA